MRIALFTHASIWGGTEVYTVALAEALSRRGHQVTIVQLAHRVYETLGPSLHRVAVQHLDPGTPFEEAGFARWVRLFRSLEYDVGVLVKSWHLGTSVALELAMRFCFGPYVVIELHPADPPPPRSNRRHFGGRVPGLGLWWYRYWLGWRVLKRLPRRIVALSDSVVEQLVSLYGYDASIFSRVHAGVDVDAYRPDPVRRADARAVWGAGPDTVVFGAVGRLATIKGFDVALDGLSSLVARYPDRRFLLVLAGTGPERERLQAQALALGIHDRVLFPGWVQNSQDVLCGLDLFLMPSRQEGLGIALLEAMACGCCPIAMGVGGVAEVLTHEELGWRVPPGDAEGFAVAMEAGLTATPEERQAMGVRARAHVLQHFDATKQFRQIARLIEQP